MQWDGRQSNDPILLSCLMRGEAIGATIPREMKPGELAHAA
jgi:hypothetical protein